MLIIPVKGLTNPVFWNVQIILMFQILRLNSNKLVLGAFVLRKGRIKFKFILIKILIKV